MSDEMSSFVYLSLTSVNPTFILASAMPAFCPLLASIRLTFFRFDSSNAFAFSAPSSTLSFLGASSL